MSSCCMPLHIHVENLVKILFGSIFEVLPACEIRHCSTQECRCVLPLPYLAEHGFDLALVAKHTQP